MKIVTRYGALDAPDDQSDLIVQFLNRYGEWGWDETSFVSSVIPVGGRILDAGAFLGTFGLGVAQQRNLSQVCFIEANPVIGTMLRKNAKRILESRGVVVEALITDDTSRTATGRRSKNNLGSTSFADGSEGDTMVASPVSSVTLAAMRKDFGPFDLIKLDIEGLEYDVLASDAAFLSKGKTAIWLECNEDPRSLEVGELILSWGLDLYYFACNTFNPKNFKRDKRPIFQLAYEAGLLVAPATAPTLSADLIANGSMLKRIKSIEDLRLAMWQTPRWGLDGWHAAATAAVAGIATRAIAGEDYGMFLRGGSAKPNERLQSRLHQAIMAQRKAEDTADLQQRALVTAEHELRATTRRNNTMQSLLIWEKQQHQRTLQNLKKAKAKLDKIPKWIKFVGKQAGKLSFKSAPKAKAPIFSSSTAPASTELDVLRRQLNAAMPPRQRALSWQPNGTAASDISSAQLAAALSAKATKNSWVISVSHDDYRVNLGGVQNVIGDEERAFVRDGFSYLHISPAAPLPMLTDPQPPRTFIAHLRLNGLVIGRASFDALLDALAAAKSQFGPVTFVVHHLLGHAPELITELCRTVPNSTTLFWAHDYLAGCPGYTLMRNDISFCGAPPVNSSACSICCYGVERADHVQRISDFLAATNAQVLAPSDVALHLWRKASGLDMIKARVVPLAELSHGGTLRSSTNKTFLRIAHAGTPAFHKGWQMFKELAETFGTDSRYQFYQLGTAPRESFPPSITTIQVKVDQDHRDAMTSALIANDIDVVVNWSLWPETFCYVIHESMAAGTFVVVRDGIGNVAPAALKNAPGRCATVDSKDELFALFAGPGLAAMVHARQPEIRTLTLGSGTADILAKTDKLS